MSGRDLVVQDLAGGGYNSRPASWAKNFPRSPSAMHLLELIGLLSPAADRISWPTVSPPSVALHRDLVASTACLRRWPMRFASSSECWNTVCGDRSRAIPAAHLARRRLPPTTCTVDTSELPCSRVPAPAAEVLAASSIRGADLRLH